MLGLNWSLLRQPMRGGCRELQAVLRALLATLSLTVAASVTAAPINIAPLYGVATARDYYLNLPRFGPAELAIDGNPLNHWNGSDYGTAMAPSWLIVDLQQNFYVEQVVLQTPDNDDLMLGLNNVYRFYVSLDGIDWEFVASGTLTDSDSFPGYADIITIPSSLSVFRLAKYEVVGGSHWATLGEMQIFAEPLAVPSPATLPLVAFGLIGLWGLRLRRRPVEQTGPTPDHPCA